MKKSLLCIALLSFASSLFAQQGTPVRNLFGSGPPGAAMAQVVGTTYVDQSTTPPTVYTCTSATLTPSSSTCTWTASGGGGPFPQTVSGTVNSGGIPCFTSTTNEASSATLAAGVLPMGGGAGACVSASSVKDSGGTVSTTEPVATGASPCVGLTPGTGGVYCGNEGTTPTVFPASTDSWWQNSTAHCEDEFANGVELGCALVQPAGVVGVQTITGADYTNTTTTPSTVFSWTLPATTVAKNYRYTCDILWESTAATLVGPVFGLNISAAPTQLTGNAAVQNTLAGADVNGYLSNNTTGSQTLVTSGAAGVTTTNYWAKIWGTIEGAAVAGSTFIINAASTSGVTASLNIRRGAGCDLKLIQ